MEIGVQGDSEESMRTKEKGKQGKSILKKRNNRNKVKQLLRELSDDEDKDMPVLSLMHGDPQQPWLQEFHGYLNSKDQLTSGMSIIQWWGHNTARYPV